MRVQIKRKGGTSALDCSFYNGDGTWRDQRGRRGGREKGIPEKILESQTKCLLCFEQDRRALLCFIPHIFTDGLLCARDCALGIIACHH